MSLEQSIIQQLRSKRILLSTVESCTGGLIAHLLTNVPGASAVYFGSTVAYDNSFKVALGVELSLIESYGAVSPEVARALAERGLESMQKSLDLLSSHTLLKPQGFLCLATTGIAGPTGGSPEKPVGLCYLGLALKGQPTVIEKFLAPRIRERVEIKIQFAHKAFELIRSALERLSSTTHP